MGLYSWILNEVPEARRHRGAATSTQGRNIGVLLISLLILR